jgi:hypothetical protein
MSRMSRQFITCSLTPLSVPLSLLFEQFKLCLGLELESLLLLGQLDLAAVLLLLNDLG